MTKARKPTPKQQAAIDEQRVRHAYHRVASGVEVPIFSLTAIKKAGMAAIAAGADDAALDQAVRDAVDAARA